jgi:hypothetical protein
MVIASIVLSICPGDDVVATSRKIRRDIRTASNSLVLLRVAARHRRFKALVDTRRNCDQIAARS